jgi:hypothetical protein
MLISPKISFNFAEDVPDIVSVAFGVKNICFMKSAKTSLSRTCITASFLKIRRDSGEWRDVRGERREERGERRGERREERGEREGIPEKVKLMTFPLLVQGSIGRYKWEK